MSQIPILRQALEARWRWTPDKGWHEIDTQAIYRYDRVTRQWYEVEAV